MGALPHIHMFFFDVSLYFAATGNDQVDIAEGMKRREERDRIRKERDDEQKARDDEEKRLKAAGEAEEVSSSRPCISEQQISHISCSCYRCGRENWKEWKP